MCDGFLYCLYRLIAISIIKVVEVEEEEAGGKNITKPDVITTAMCKEAVRDLRQHHP